MISDESKLIANYLSLVTIGHKKTASFPNGRFKIWFRLLSELFFYLISFFIGVDVYVDNWGLVSVRGLHSMYYNKNLIVFGQE